MYLVISCVETLTHILGGGRNWLLPWLLWKVERAFPTLHRQKIIHALFSMTYWLLPLESAECTSPLIFELDHVICFDNWNMSRSDSVPVPS